MYVGQPLKRREDIRFVTGRGHFVDDLLPPTAAYVGFLRSPHAHARIARLCTDRAEAAAGVLKVLTARDWQAAGLGTLVCVHPMPFSDGRPMNEALRPAFAQAQVCHVGDIVAAVAAEDRFALLDALERIEIEYEPLPAVGDMVAALEPEAALVHAELGTNLVNEVVRGDAAAARAAFAGAAHITELTLSNNRLAANPIEPRAYVAEHDAATGATTLWATIQMPHMLRRWICKYTLRIPENELRVIAPDVGGGFGVKGHFAVEVSTVVWLARLIGRPTKWTATRSETLLSDAQARDHLTKARMAFDADGKITALEVDTLANFGGYCSNFGPSIPGNSYPQTITGLYTTPTLQLSVRGVYTNTVPIDAYRGSGRPEAALVNERLLENGAREMGIDVAEIRMRNFIAAHQFPYRSASGRTFDSGDPPAMLAKLLAMSDYQALRREQAALRRRGTLMGIGLAAFLDKSGTGPSQGLASRGGLHGGYETATVRVHSDGKVTLLVGTHSHGQGHDITYAQIAADRLGLAVDDIAVVEGDTARIPFGNGTWGSRSVSVGGTAVWRAADRVLAKARRFAAHVLGCAEPELAYENGYFATRRTNRRLSFAEIADMAYHGAGCPPGEEPGLEQTVFHDPPDANDPMAIHLAVVVVDAETGRITLRDYFTVDDCGIIINPLIVEGQVQGGLAQGIGQAMLEHVIYDRDNGQLLTGTFMDYAMPRARDMPALRLDFIATPAPSNPLGAKGGSETGTIGPPAAIGNAVVDALWHLGVRNIALPLTPQTVWRAIAAADPAAARAKAAPHE